MSSGKTKRQKKKDKNYELKSKKKKKDKRRKEKKENEAAQFTVKTIFGFKTVLKGGNQEMENHKKEVFEIGGISGKPPGHSFKFSSFLRKPPCKLQLGTDREKVLFQILFIFA